MTLDIEHRLDGWWIVGLPEGDPDCGPYDTRREAKEDAAGLKRFYKFSDRPGWMTTDSNLLEV